MVYKKIKKHCISLVSIALSVSLTACVGDKQLKPSTNKNQMQITKAQASILDHGIISYYFMDDSNIPTFSVPLMNSNTIEHNLAQYHNRIAKHLVAKFDLTVEKSGIYQLSTSETGTSISIDDNLAANQSVSFEAGKIYSIAVAYAAKTAIVKDLELRWLEPGAKTITRIPTNNILFATTKSLSPKSILAKNATNCKAFGLEDSSCNGIPDEWCLHGYTLYTNPDTGKILLERWDDTIHANNGYKKFFSAVYKFSTADDPYSDYQKVTGIGLDKGVSKDARNPLVAAVPIIYAKSDGVIISKNTNITTDINGSSGKSISISTSNSASDGSSDDAGGSLSISPGISIFPPSISVNDTFTAKYDHQWNHSQTLTQGKDSSGSVNNGWSTSLNMNNADAAYFLPIMRYENIGTAPVYDLAPTFTFMEPKQKLVLNSVTAKSNSIANSLLPDSSYPKAGQPGILISGNDDFNSQPARLNKSQMDALEKNKIFATYVNQFTAKVKFFNNSGQPVNLPDRDNSWEAYLTQSGQTTTRIKLFTPDSQVKVRKIASRDPDVPQENLSKPEVLLEDALALIGGLKYNQGTKKWEVLDEDGKVTYEIAEIEIFSEPDTMKEINKQLLAMPGAIKQFGKIKLRAKMQLTVCPKGIVVNQQNKSVILWQNCQPMIFSKLVWFNNPAEFGGDKDLINIVRIDVPTNYRLGDSANIDMSTGLADNSFDLFSSDVNIISQPWYWGNGNIAMKVQGKTGSATVTIKYKGTNMIAKTLTVNVYKPLDKLEIYAQHQNRYYQWGSGVFSAFLYNIYFRLSTPVASQIKSYSVQVDDGAFHTQLRYSYENNQIKLNLLDYNAGYGVKEWHRVIVRAELTNGDSIKVMEEYIRR